MTSGLEYKTPAQRVALLRRRKTLTAPVRQQLRKHDVARDALRKVSQDVRLFRAQHRNVLRDWSLLRHRKARAIRGFACARRCLHDLAGIAPFYIPTIVVDTDEL